MADAPNLLFIFSDQHAQGIAGCYGDALVDTPSLDRLAARGVVFDNAYTPSPLCTPARMAMLAAQHPHRVGCWTNSDLLASDVPTHAHALGAAGCRTLLVGRLHAIGPDQLHGYSERHVGDHSTNWAGGRGHGLGVLARTNDPFRVSVERSGPGQSSYEVKDRDVVAATLRVLDDLAAERGSGHGSPFALTVGLMLPHQPYVCAPADFERYRGRIGPPRLAAPAAQQEHPYLRRWRAHTQSVDLPPDWVLRARAAYYGLVTSMDRMIGQVLDRLEALGLAQNTLVVYSSDHGDQLGERGLWWKQTFYEQSAKVPLILSWPGDLPRGERRAQVVNLIDVAATLLDAQGAPALPNAQGRSLLGVARDAAAPWEDETFSEYCTDGMSPWTLPDPVQQRMIRSGPWKLVHYQGAPPQLFNLDDDPDELRDLAADPGCASVRERLAAKVLHGWDPDRIAARMARRIADKRLLQRWAQRVEPPESHRWTVKVEDNWLADEAAEDSA